MPGPRTALALLLAAALVAAVGAASAGAVADGGPIKHLCGVAKPVDRLLDCKSGSSKSGSSGSTSSTTTTTSASSTSKKAPGPQLAPGVAARHSATTPHYVPATRIVTIKPGVRAARVTALLRRAGVRVKRNVTDIRAIVVRLPRTHQAHALAILRRSGLLAVAQRDPVVQTLSAAPNDSFWPDQWGLRAIGMQGAWAITHGRRIKVAVVDTGVNRSLPDLRGAVLPGIDLVAGSTGATDTQGHGSAVAGVIAARSNNRTGEAGICWLCAILPVKVMSADGKGDEGTIASGIVRAADAGARVINLSVGSPASTQALANAVVYAQHKGSVIVAAAGNSGTQTRFYPAAYPGVISVAGINPGKRLYAWSNRGSWVSVAAPGCNVSPLLTGQYGNFCGTSSATPVVAGIAALVLAKHPAASQAAVVAAIERSVLRVSGPVHYGFVQAPGALR